MFRATTAVLSFVFLAAIPPEATAQNSEKQLISPEKQSIEVIIRVPPEARVDIQGPGATSRTPAQGPAATARMRPPNISGDFDCSCMGGDGTCTIQTGPGSMFCYKKMGDTCTASCELTLTTTGSDVGPITRRR